MFASLMNAFFGCTHRNTTFPISVRGSKTLRSRVAWDTYVVCLDCGKEFAYSWDEMRILPGSERTMAGVQEHVGSFLTTK